MVDTPQIPAQPILPGRALRIRLPSVPLYAGTLFVSALLLFWVQPLIAKMMLPLLGGAPAVWNTAMMFFQLVLLAGYGYAHLLTRAVPPSRQVWIHGAVLVTAVTALPFAVGDQVPPTDAASPVVALWLVGRLFVIVGLPFFALAAAAPRYGDSPAAIVMPASPTALWRGRALWIALAFVPSSLLLGVTSYITTDVASAPLLWVIPLALYLLSFVVAFARRPPIRASWSLAGQAASIGILLFL